MPRVSAADEPLLPAARSSQETSFLGAPADPVEAATAQLRASASQLVDVESTGSERRAAAQSMCRWLCVVVFYSVACASLWYFLWGLYFGDADGSNGQKCVDEQYDRDTVHWVMESAPVWARNSVLMTAVAHRGRTLVCLTSRGSGIVEEICNRGGRSDGTINHN